MGKNFSKNQHFADFSACSGHPVLNLNNANENVFVFSIYSKNSTVNNKNSSFNLQLLNI
jgi:hypothetical protein